MHAEAVAGTPPPRRLWRRATKAIDRLIGFVVEPLAALVIVAEVCILASGVFSRYVLHNALPWTDELATYLFLWLTMLGAVVAYRRDEHMRMNALFRVVSPGVRETLEIVSTAVIALFCIELIPASRTFYDLETIDFTPELNLPRSLDIVAILVGLSLILVLAILRLIDSNPRRSIPVVAVAAAIAVAAFVGHGALTGLGNVNLVLFFVVVVGACVAIGIPIAFSFGFGTLSYLALATTSPLSTVVGRMTEGIGNLV
ncbi:MAG: TRAP transporter small permease, partial [Vulcanimicrobiaceae bacterium]